MIARFRRAARPENRNSASELAADPLGHAAQQIGRTQPGGDEGSSPGYGAPGETRPQDPSVRSPRPTNWRNGFTFGQRLRIGANKPYRLTAWQYLPRSGKSCRRRPRVQYPQRPGHAAFVGASGAHCRENLARSRLGMPAPAKPSAIIGAGSVVPRFGQSPVRFMARRDGEKRSPEPKRIPMWEPPSLAFSCGRYLSSYLAMNLSERRPVSFSLAAKRLPRAPRNSVADNLSHACGRLSP